MKDIKIITLLFFVMVGIPLNVNGQTDTSISLNKAYFDFSLERGEVTTYEINVRNDGSTPVTINPKPVNFTATDTTGGMVFDTLESTDEIFNWFTIEPQQLFLDPEEFKTVIITVIVPHDATFGGHYASVLFEPDTPPNSFKEEKPKIVSTLGALFLLTVTDPDAKKVDSPFIMESFQLGDHNEQDAFYRLNTLIEKFFFSNSEVQVFSKIPTLYTLRISNNDIVHRRPQGILTITSANGKEAVEGAIEERTILPNRSRDYDIEGERVNHSRLRKYAPFGLYTAKIVILKVNAGAGSKKSTIEFFIVYWPTVFIYVSLGFALIILIVFRKRFFKALIILLKRR